MDEIKNFFQDKDVLVTGGCGSIGSEIVRGLLKLNARRVRSFDNNEHGQFNLHDELKHYSQFRTLMGDIRDKTRLKMAMKDVDIVFHAAALKHVPMCEYNPFEAVATNVFGVQNVIEAAREADVGRFIFISTDKAVNPINTMGATKLLGEKIVLNAPVGDDKTIFSCVRFGNVLDSSGSVIPIFRKQIMKGGPVTITSPEMTRFFMSIPDAINLIFKATMIAKGREIFILKMNAMKIMDLAEAMIDEFAPKYGFSPPEVKIKTTGIRPGEKIHESLLTEEETWYAEDINGMIVLRPGIISPHYVEEPELCHGNSRICDSINSNSGKCQTLGKEEIRKLLRDTLKP